jgi:putative PIN family toxin of toxin-antitoxin system
MIRAVFDTNVLVSARLSLLGNPARCLALANLRQIESITCQSILDEFVEKLISKFDYEPSRAAEAADQVRKISRLVELGETPHLVPEDADDDKIVQCALVGGASHIVSGDKHLLALKNYKDIAIVRPTDFLSLVAVVGFN